MWFPFLMSVGLMFHCSIRPMLSEHTQNADKHSDPQSDANSLPQCLGSSTWYYIWTAVYIKLPYSPPRAGPLPECAEKHRQCSEQQYRQFLSGCKRKFSTCIRSFETKINTVVHKQRLSPYKVVMGLFDARLSYQIDFSPIYFLWILYNDCFVSRGFSFGVRIKRRPYL
jgi:hypothetical protein